MYLITVFLVSVFSFSLFYAGIKDPSYIRHVRFTSQYEQDKWVLENLFEYKKNGFYVDIGAWDGEYYSNTYALEKYFKWKGICVEANPIKFQSLVSNRESINVNACLDYTNHEVYFRYDNDLFGGIVDIDTDNKDSFRPDLLSDLMLNNNILKMRTKTLEEILDESSAPKVIDFLSIDVEGAEYRIFKNFPFSKYTFLCMVIERPSPELNRLLQENGYVFVRNHYVDTYYVHSSINGFESIEKDPFEQNDWGRQ